MSCSIRQLLEFMGRAILFSSYGNCPFLHKATCFHRLFHYESWMGSQPTIFLQKFDNWGAIWFKDAFMPTPFGHIFDLETLEWNIKPVSLGVLCTLLNKLTWYSVNRERWWKILWVWNLLTLFVTHVSLVNREWKPWWVPSKMTM